VVEESVEADGNLCVPLVPGVSAGPGVELIGEMAGLEAGGEAAIGIEKRLLFTGSEEDVGSCGGIGGLNWPQRLKLKRRLGTSMAGLMAPAKAKRSGRARASLMAVNPPMETPTMARFSRVLAAGNRDSTSAIKSLTR
jgi:hypothetical protein